MLIRTLSDLSLDRFTLDKMTLDKMTLDRPPFISGGGGIDQYTKLMLHMNGANGSTIFTDSSLSHKAVTANGNAQISTAQSVFGGASGYFNGTNSYIDCGNNSDLVLGTENFTVDFWMNPSTINSTFGRIVTSSISGFTSGTFCIRLSNANKITFTNATFTLTSTTTPSVGTWYHVAVVKSSGIVKLCINGVAEASAVDTNNYAEALRYIGGHYNGSSEYYHGNVDELRISNIARWTSNFTPPTQEYSLAA